MSKFLCKLAVNAGLAASAIALLLGVGAIFVAVGSFLSVSMDVGVSILVFGLGFVLVVLGATIGETLITRLR